MARIYIPFYSRYGNVETMAGAVAEGVEAAGGEPIVAYVGDPITPEEVIAKDERWLATHTRCSTKYPLATVEALREVDGIAFGAPTRFGNFVAQMRLYFDRMAPLWMDGSLIGKPGAVFTSSASLHGGQESTIIASWFPMIHLGMLIVGVPYSEQLLLTTKTGGSPYGPGHIAGAMGDIPPDETELAICRTLGKRIAEIAEKLRQ
jgi:NAD(P)H dehydrogenase (quinone)